MNDDLAVAVLSSPRPWANRVSRHWGDHGPAMVVDVISEARNAFDFSWRLLVGDGDHSLMTEAFVASVHRQGRGVVAVIDPSDHRAKQRALDAGADALIELDATMEEWERILTDAAVLRPAPRVAASRRRTAVASEPSSGGQLVAVGGPPGSPAAEVALTLGWWLAGRKGQSAAILDADETTPSLAALLALAPLPNLASAVAALRTGNPLAPHLSAADRLAVLPGLVDPAQWADVTPSGVRAALSALTAAHDRAVALVGPVLHETERQDRYGTSRAALGEASTVVAVCAASPVGLVRLHHWIAEARLVAPRAALWLVACGHSKGYRAAEVEASLAALGELPGVRAVGVRVLPLDARRGERAAWQGGIIRGGSFASSVKKLSKEVCP